MIYDIPAVQVIVGTILILSIFIAIGLNMTVFADYEEVEESHITASDAKCTVYWINKKVS
jgi:hypothetical protein